MLQSIRKQHEKARFFDIGHLFDQPSGTRYHCCFQQLQIQIGIENFSFHSRDVIRSDHAIFAASGGLQIVRRFGNSKSSLESGVYMMTKGAKFIDRYISTVVFRNLTIPINYRYDTKVFYVAGGLYADYLIGRQNSREEMSSMYLDRELNFGFNLILGIEKSISKHLTLLIEGHRFNNLTSYESGGPQWLEFGLANTGFSIGLNYKVLR